MKNDTNDQLLSELWSTAIFDSSSFDQLEKIAAGGVMTGNEEDIYLSLTTSRNRNLITPVEQQQLQNTVVVFFGLSVGSHAVTTWMLESRAKEVKIIDPDTVDATNLNRLRFGWDTVGKKKKDIVMQQLLSINPYAHITATDQIDRAMTESIILKTPKANILVDEMDDLEGKIYIRQLAKKQKIPVLSATDVGDNIIVDIERYDSTQQPKLFLGRVPNVEKIQVSELSYIDKIRLILRIVGLEYCSEAMLDSLLAIGKTLPTWPQLAATATISGGVVTTVIKKIILGESIQSGRYAISLDTLFVDNYSHKERKRLRKEKILRIKRKFSIE